MDVAPKDNEQPRTRRAFLSLAIMSGGLVAAYGFFASFIARFLYPVDEKINRKPLFVAYADQLPPGTSKSVLTPRGEQILLTNTGQLRPGANHGYIAFSSRCPHLGCKVHYESKKERFICPCHQGVFNQKGIATAGPPAQAGQRLSSYRVKTEGNAIFLMVEVS